MIRRTVISLLCFAGAAAAQDTVPTAPEDGGPRAFEVVVPLGRLNVLAAPSTTAEAVARLEPGTQLANLGCLMAEDRAWCEVQEIAGGPRGYAAAVFLEPATGPDGQAALGPDMSALRAGQGDFDATGDIACDADARCAFGVARASAGYATVVVTRPGGGERIIYFALGHAIGASMAQADPSGPFAARRDGDTTVVTLGDERYAIPDAVPLGG